MGHACGMNGLVLSECGEGGGEGETNEKINFRNRSRKTFPVFPRDKRKSKGKTCVMLAVRILVAKKGKSKRRLNSVIHEAMLSEGKYPFVLLLYIISLFLPVPSFYLWPLVEFATVIRAMKHHPTY